MKTNLPFIFLLVLCVSCQGPQIGSLPQREQYSTAEANYLQEFKARIQRQCHMILKNEIVPESRVTVKFWIAENGAVSSPEIVSEKVIADKIRKAIAEAFAHCSPYKPFPSPRVSFNRPKEHFKLDVIIKEPNQALEPTTTAVTPRADARVAPSAVVAHL
jgi:hypothetical protein